jgi:hypothetical protein
MLEAMQHMLAQLDATIARTGNTPEVALGYRMALVDLIETYQKLEKQNEQTA